jgi:hypothetical protein
VREIQSLPSGLGELREGEATVELRFVNSRGQTEAWVMKAEPDILDVMGRIGKLGVVWKAYIDDQTDSRLGTQSEHIARLLRHLQHHHQELGHRAAEDCDVLSGKVRLQ